jgi:hypothetical protein
MKGIDLPTLPGGRGDIYQEPDNLQTEAFGTASLIVIADDIRQMKEVASVRRESDRLYLFPYAGEG